MYLAILGFIFLTGYFPGTRACGSGSTDMNPMADHIMKHVKQFFDDQKIDKVEMYDLPKMNGGGIEATIHHLLIVNSWTMERLKEHDVILTAQCDGDERKICFHGTFVLTRLTVANMHALVKWLFFSIEAHGYGEVTDITASVGFCLNPITLKIGMTHLIFHDIGNLHLVIPEIPQFVLDVLMTLCVPIFKGYVLNQMSLYLLPLINGMMNDLLNLVVVGHVPNPATSCCSGSQHTCSQCCKPNPSLLSELNAVAEIIQRNGSHLLG